MSAPQATQATPQAVLLATIESPLATRLASQATQATQATPQAVLLATIKSPLATRLLASQRIQAESILTTHCQCRSWYANRDE
jgi:hypothetical protein